MSKTSEQKFRIKQIGSAILDLPRRITEPSNKIIDEGTRRKARFLSVVLFLATIIFPVLQISVKTTSEIPLFSGSAILIAGFYLLSKTEHVRLTSALTIIFLASFTFFILIVTPVWNSHSLAFHLMIWPILAVLLGSQLLSKEKEAVLIIGMNLGLLLLCYFHQGIVFFEAAEFIVVSLGIQGPLWFTSWTAEYYTTKIEENNNELETRSRELEMYTSLLRHDLANDIQMILGGLELAQMTADDLKRQASFLESALAAAERMMSLIHVFSVAEDELDKNLAAVLVIICKRAQIAFKGMLVTLDIEEEVHNQPLCYGKLTALAFENLLRNTAQYAGDSPNVLIKISLAEDHLVIVFEDDGPGIAVEIRDQLFGKGVTTGPKGRGLGLYLTKSIIESEGGNISLADNEKPGCCFQILLPLH